MTEYKDGVILCNGKNISLIPNVTALDMYLYTIQIQCDQLYLCTFEILSPSNLPEKAEYSYDGTEYRCTTVAAFKKLLKGINNDPTDIFCSVDFPIYTAAVDLTGDVGYAKTEGVKLLFSPAYSDILCYQPDSQNSPYTASSIDVHAQKTKL